MKEYLMNEFALRLNELSAEWWGKEKAIHFVGCHSTLMEAQRKLLHFTMLDEPVLITGESGVGKEIFAKSLYLLSARRGKTFISVNCAQYHDQNTLISELFGHKKGSFTGAIGDRQGIFKECDGGVIFLDEIGELTLKSQAMLLRVLAEGEIKPLGSNKLESVNVRVVAATNRDLRNMLKNNQFREDLYYRLRHFHLHVPALRERGNDWEMLVRYHLQKLNHEYGSCKVLSERSWEMLSHYFWPGNIRELKSIVTTGYSLSGERKIIEPNDFIFLLREEHPFDASDNMSSVVLECFNRMSKNQESFWQVVQKPYLNRDLNRSQVKAIMRLGLNKTNGSYKQLLSLFGLAENQYLKFMDFLRHHHLKP